MKPLQTVVVGGTRGGGRAWARLAALKGRAVTVVGRGPLPPDLALPGVAHVRADLATSRGVAAACKAIAARGGVDSVAFFQRFRGDGDDWEGNLSVGLGATRAIVEALAGRFGADGARAIVMVGSVANRLVAREQGPGYHVAKAGMLQLARYYAATLGPAGIRVNSVSPGTIVKQESAAFYAKQRALLAVYARAIPLGRMGRAEEVASVIDFLCGPQASYVTGQDLVVDGGLSLLWQETLAREIALPKAPRITRRGDRR